MLWHLAAIPSNLETFGQEALPSWETAADSKAVAVGGGGAVAGVAVAAAAAVAEAAVAADGAVGAKLIDAAVQVGRTAVGSMT